MVGTRSGNGARLRGGVILGLVVAASLVGCGVQKAESGVDGSQGYVGASVSRPDGASGPATASPSAEKTTVVPELASMNVGSARLIEVPASAATGEPDLGATVAVERVYKLSEEQAAGLNGLTSEGGVTLAGGQYVGVVKDTGRKPGSLKVFGSGADTQVRVVTGAQSEEFVSTRCECDAVENPGFIERAWIVPLDISVEQASALVVR
ncbi:hypothetical protein [Haematomicrobium sanguinis]|uniref:hypothetical protein n=1 Tax=Haematomicrobium sanguinis TaxID=479106 RepID=UPI00047AD5CD|nr:hypothetical protein [Haematomicrobium sanguinis]